MLKLEQIHGMVCFVAVCLVHWELKGTFSSHEPRIIEDTRGDTSKSCDLYIPKYSFT